MLKLEIRVIDVRIITRKFNFYYILKDFVEFEFFMLMFGLFVVAVLYSSVGHGGASGYLAVMSLTSYGMMSGSWLKQHVWCLNVIVAGIAFFNYYRNGFHISKLTLPFIITSIPFAMLGGFLIVNGALYDTLLSIVLIWAAFRLLKIDSNRGTYELDIPSLKTSLPIGGGIGFISGIIGVGGGIFLSPIMLLNKWASAKNVAATSALFIWVNSVAGIAGATISGQSVIDFEILMPFSIVVVLGGMIGSRLGAVNAHEVTIRRLLVVV